MDASQALAFLLFAFVAAVTPGPSNTMILSTGASLGITMRGIVCPIGAALGMGSMIILSALGIGEIVAAAPAIITAMKLAGSLFLLWLTWKILNAGAFEPGRQTGAVGFTQAFLFQWLNPKGWLVAFSAGSTYLVPDQQSQFYGALWMGLLFASSALPAGLIWFGMGALASSYIRKKHSMTVFNRLMAGLLFASIIIVWR